MRSSNKGNVYGITHLIHIIHPRREYISQNAGGLQKGILQIKLVSVYVRCGVTCKRLVGHSEASPVGANALSYTS